MVTSVCAICGVEVARRGSKPAIYCSRVCGSEGRRRWKPVDRDWLYQKYVVEGLGTTKIARLVHRDPKRVYGWLVDFGIPLRAKWQGGGDRSGLHWRKDWLASEYANGRTIEDLAKEIGLPKQTVASRMKAFGISSRTTEESLKFSGNTRVYSGDRHPMYGRRGERCPSWKGGVTPERQAFYGTNEWINVRDFVWIRDNATCQRCNVRKTNREQFYCIHHITSFAVKELRAEPTNLVLLCRECHWWVHSRDNSGSDFLKK